MLASYLFAQDVFMGSYACPNDAELFYQIFLFSFGINNSNDIKILSPGISGYVHIIFS